MIKPEIAADMCLLVESQIAALEGVLSACDDSVERTRLENALSGLRSLSSFYLIEAAR